MPIILLNEGVILEKIMQEVSINGMGAIVIFTLWLSCHCSTCPSADEVKCDGKPYVSKNMLQCEHYTLAYEIECEH